MNDPMSVPDHFHFPHPAGSSRHPDRATLQTEDFEIDLIDRCARYPDGQGVRFTPRQWQLLKLLIDVAPRGATRVSLCLELFSGDTVDGRDTDRLATLISQLRRKLEPDPGHPRYVPSIDGLNYTFDAEGWARCIAR